MLKMLQLGKHLQSALSELLRKCSLLNPQLKSDEDYVVPQVFSTLPHLLDFPSEIFMRPTMQMTLSDKPEIDTEISYDRLQEMLEKGNQPLVFQEKSKQNQDLTFKILAEFETASKAAEEKGHFNVQNINKHIESLQKVVGREFKKPNNREIRTWLVSSAPGMGKSMLSKNIAMFLKRRYSALTIFEIHLKDVVNIFVKKRSGLISVQSFLEHVEKQENVGNLLKENKVAIILDGFDEIRRPQRIKVLALVKTIVESKIPLWISTRPQERKQIEQVLQITDFATLEIQPLAEEDQKSLVEVISKKSKQHCVEFLEQLAESGAANVTENPLNLTMIAQRLSFKADLSINIFDLYKDIFLNKLEGAFDKKDEMEEAILLLAKTATMSFSDGGFSFLQDDEVEKINRTGFTTVQKDKSSAKFVHKTYVEFIIAYHALELTNDDFEDEFQFSEIFELDENDDRFVQTRCFIESYLAFERELPNSFELFLQEIDATRRGSFLKVLCTEGLHNMFKLFVLNTNLQHAITAITENLMQLFQLASSSNQELSLQLIDMTNNAMQLFAEEQNVKLIVKNVIENNYTELFKKLNDICPEKGKIMSLYYDIISDTDNFLPLHFTVRNNYIQMLQLLLCAGADVNHSDDEGFTALHYAMNNLECAQILVKTFPELLYRKTERDFSVLHTAAGCTTVEMVEFLVSNGLDPLEKDINGMDALYYAADCGKLEIAKYLLQKSVNSIDEKDIDGWTPLCAASRNGHSEVVELLCESGADINILDDEGWTALHHASRYGNLKCVQLLVQKEKSLLTKTTPTNISALGFATKNSDVEIVKFLVENGMQPLDKNGSEGLNALHTAAMEGNLEIVEYLLTQCKGGINEQTVEGTTAIRLAIGNNHIDVALLLAKNGANCVRGDKETLSLLHHLAMNGTVEQIKTLVELDKYILLDSIRLNVTALHLAVLTSNLEVIKFLIEVGFNPAEKNFIGQNSLYYASGEGHIEIVEYLLETDEEMINEADCQGWTALLQACKHKRLEVVKLLCEKGANIRATTLEGGYTALHTASRYGNLECVKYLIARDKTLLEQKTSISESVLHLAAMNDDIEIIQYFVESGLDPLENDSLNRNTLHLSAKEGDPEIFKSLLNMHPEKINEIDLYGWTPLHYAARNSNCKIVKMLCEMGANLKMTGKWDFATAANAAKSTSFLATYHAPTGENGWSALHLASTYAKFHCVQLLVEKDKTLIHAKTELNCNALHLAASNYAETDIVPYLVSCGLEPSEKDVNGANALHHAAEEGHIENLKWLLENFTELINEVEDRGWTALHFAAKKGNIEIVELLIESGADLKMRTLDGFNSLHLAVYHSHLEIVQKLILKSPSLTSETVFANISALHIAAGNADLKLSEFLVQSGMDPLETDSFGKTCLHWAAENNKLANLKYFLHFHNGYVNVSAQGCTPLHFATVNCSFEAIEYLAENKADFHAKDKEGYTAFDLALFRNDAVAFIGLYKIYFKYLCSENKIFSSVLEESAETIREYQFNDKTEFGHSALHIALVRADLELIQLMVDKGADIEVKDDKGLNALHYAVQFCGPEIVQFLLETEKGKECVHERDYLQNTPLFYAVHKADLNIFQLLLANGADPRARDRDGGTPFHDAALDAKRIPMIHFILDSGLAEIDDQRHGDEKSALHLAAEVGCLDVVKVLTARGANLQLRNKDGETALESAERNERFKCAEFIQELLIGKVSITS